MKHYASKELQMDLCNILNKYHVNADIVNAVMEELCSNDCMDTQTLGASAPVKCCSYDVTCGNSAYADVHDDGCDL